MPEISKRALEDIIFHHGLWETRYVTLDTAKELKTIDPEGNSFHVDFERVIKTPKDPSMVVVSTKAFWKECSERKNKLRSELDLEKAKLDAKAERINLVRTKLTEKANLPKEVVTEMLNRALEPKDDSDFQLRAKFGFDFQELFNKIEENFKKENGVTN